jgi:hypothetical protein
MSVGIIFESINIKNISMKNIICQSGLHSKINENKSLFIRKNKGKRQHPELQSACFSCFSSYLLTSSFRSLSKSTFSSAFVNVSTGLSLLSMRWISICFVFKVYFTNWYLISSHLVPLLYESFLRMATALSLSV